MQPLSSSLLKSQRCSDQPRTKHFVSSRKQPATLGKQKYPPGQWLLQHAAPNSCWLQKPPSHRGIPGFKRPTTSGCGSASMAGCQRRCDARWAAPPKSATTSTTRPAILTARPTSQGELGALHRSTAPSLSPSSTNLCVQSAIEYCNVKVAPYLAGLTTFEYCRCFKKQSRYLQRATLRVTDSKEEDRQSIW